MREVVVTVKDGETEETAQGLVGQVRVRWGPEDLPKAKSLDLICAQIIRAVEQGRIRGDKGRDREDCAVVQARHAGLGRRAEKTVEEKQI